MCSHSLYHWIRIEKCANTHLKANLFWDVCLHTSQCESSDGESGSIYPYKGKKKLRSATCACVPDKMDDESSVVRRVAIIYRVSDGAMEHHRFHPRTYMAASSAFPFPIFNFTCTAACICLSIYMGNRWLNTVLKCMHESMPHVTRTYLLRDDTWFGVVMHAWRLTSTACLPWTQQPSEWLVVTVYTVGKAYHLLTGVIA